MIDVSAAFAEMDRAVAAHGFMPESEHHAPQAFGSRSRLYRRSAREALSLTWDGRDSWLIVQGGVPWRDLALYRSGAADTGDATAVVRDLVADLSKVPDFDPAI